MQLIRLHKANRFASVIRDSATAPQSSGDLRLLTSLQLLHAENVLYFASCIGYNSQSQANGEDLDTARVCRQSDQFIETLYKQQNIMHNHVFHVRPSVSMARQDNKLNSF